VGSEWDGRALAKALRSIQAHPDALANASDELLPPLMPGRQS